MDINDSFRAACRILFGQEVGGLGEFAPYLLEMVDKPSVAVSYASGAKLFLSQPHYSKDARFAALGEPQGSGCIGINDIKDIDSLRAALFEKFAYCGNKNLGSSLDVVESDMCSDSVNVLCSHNVMDSKGVAYCNGVRQAEGAFGCMLGGEVSFSMRSQAFFYSSRCFENYMCETCSDAYFCFNCHGCAEALFCFNQNAKRHAIGNVELPAEKYLGIKKKLLGEIAGELREKKRFPSLFEMVGE